MNYLAHLYLAGECGGSLLGNLMGDFVKGPIGDRFPPDIAAGIELHRKIDSFAHTDPAFRRSRQRIDPRFGHCRSILVDIFYDHILARDWQHHARLPLEDFASHVYRLLQEHDKSLPAGLQQVAPRMIEGNWLVSYRRIETVSTVLKRLSRRLKRPTPIAEGSPELIRNYRNFQMDFEEFLPRATAMAIDYMSGLKAPGSR